MLSFYWLRWALMNFLFKLTLNCDLPVLCLLSSWDYRYEPLHPVTNALLTPSCVPCCGGLQERGHQIRKGLGISCTVVLHKSQDMGSVWLSDNHSLSHQAEQPSLDISPDLRPICKTGLPPASGINICLLHDWMSKMGLSNVTFRRWLLV
jgi:hypothetical protein